MNNYLQPLLEDKALLTIYSCLLVTQLALLFVPELISTDEQPKYVIAMLLILSICFLGSLFVAKSHFPIVPITLISLGSLLLIALVNTIIQGMPSPSNWYFALFILPILNIGIIALLSLYHILFHYFSSNKDALIHRRCLLLFASALVIVSVLLSKYNTSLNILLLPLMILTLYHWTPVQKTVNQST